MNIRCTFCDKVIDAPISDGRALFCQNCYPGGQKVQLHREIGTLISKKYECPICLQPPTNPAEPECCDHIFCTNCIVEYYKTENYACPICRVTSYCIKSLDKCFDLSPKLCEYPGCLYKQVPKFFDNSHKHILICSSCGAVKCDSLAQHVAFSHDLELKYFVNYVIYGTKLTIVARYFSPKYDYIVKFALKMPEKNFISALCRILALMIIRGNQYIAQIEYIFDNLGIMSPQHLVKFATIYKKYLMARYTLRLPYDDKYSLIIQNLINNKITMPLQSRDIVMSNNQNGIIYANNRALLDTLNIKYPLFENMTINVGKNYTIRQSSYAIVEMVHFNGCKIKCNFEYYQILMLYSSRATNSVNCDILDKLASKKVIKRMLNDNLLRKNGENYDINDDFFDNDFFDDNLVILPSDIYAHYVRNITS